MLILNTYIIEADPSVSLHGGPKGFDDVDWEVVHPSEATLFSDTEKITIGSIPAAVVFRYTSQDGDQGFPGTLLTEVLVGLVNPGQTGSSSTKDEFNLGSILFVYRARLLDENKVTPINLTQVRSNLGKRRRHSCVRTRALKLEQHWGFNLEASIQGNESNLVVKDHRLNLKVSHLFYHNNLSLDEIASGPQAGHNAATDHLGLPAGKLVATQGTAYQHNSKIIGDGYPEKGYGTCA